jgi:hypothetical protein
VISCKWLDFKLDQISGGGAALGTLCKLQIGLWTGGDLHSVLGLI